MNKDQLNERIKLLQQEQNRINQLTVQGSQQCQALAGHIAEAHHWLNELIKEENKPEEAPCDTAAVSDAA